MNKRKLLALCVAIFCSAAHSQINDHNSLESITNDLTFFKDPLATTLAENITSAEKIKHPQLKAVAQALINKNYDQNLRVASFNAILNTKTLGKQLHIGDGYSNFENLTGIYLPLGTHLILVEGIPENRDIKLMIPNWLRQPSEGFEPTKDPKGWGIWRSNHPIKNGINLINVKDWHGLAYLDFYSTNPENEKPIKIHFPNATVNGIFDITKHNDQDWNKLIDNAKYPILDALGKHIQIVYPTEALKKYAYNRGVELINNYDLLLFRQHQFLGLEKYNKVPKNRILTRVNYNYYMFRDSDGVAYMGGNPHNAMSLVVDPSRVIKGDPCWGFNHEVGHVHQLRPYFNWAGLGEVSNNVVTLYGTTAFGNKSRLSTGNFYQRAKENIIDKKISYLQNDNVLERLVPFWQLHLYFSKHGNKDFYPDLHEVFRNQPPIQGDNWGNRGDNAAEYQLNFVKQSCIVGKTDLTDFFDQYGFFYVGEFEINDYGKYQYKMTQQMVDALKAEIKAMNLPKPKLSISSMVD